MGTLRTPYAPLLAPRSTLRSLKAPTFPVKMLAAGPSSNATVAEMATTEEGQEMPRDEFMELKKQELRASGGMAISANSKLAKLAEMEREKQKKKALKREQKERKRALAKDKRALENMTADERARAEKAYLKKVLAEEKRMEKERKAMEAARSSAVFLSRRHPWGLKEDDASSQF